ncbi:ATP-binding protein [Gillisia sp. CAL575]|uniref:PAS domain-containing sensor histidine kinase n=1 Tax=Gillisia sp. CAL575 TaxID=985255 RepID=UPI0003A1BC0B|nr:ATP-binding protein [Gillisia sp. CAL575]
MENSVSKIKIDKLQQELKAAKEEIENLNRSNHHYQELIFSSTGLICILIGPNLVIDTANDAILNVWGKDKSIIGKPLLQGVPELKGQGFDTLLLNVYTTGKSFTAAAVPANHEVDGKLIKGYFDFIYQAQRDLDGAIIGVAVIASDVTKTAILNLEVKKSIHRFEELIYSSPGLIAILTGDNFIIEIANDAMIEVWGKGPDVIGKSLFEILPEIVGQGMKDKFEEVYNSGIPLAAQEFQIFHLVNNKEVKGYFDFIYQPQKDLNGNIIGVAVIANEVTKTAVLNQKIKESELKFRQLANLIPDKISNADENLKTFYYNKSWLDFSGLSLDYLLKNGWAELIHPDDIPSILTNTERALKTKENFEMELRCRDKEGNYIWHLARASAIRNELGEFQSWVTATTEIHKIKEEELRKENFLKMVSHELKTPVTSIKGYVQLLLSMIKLYPDLQNTKIPLESSLSRIDNQVTRLIRLISELLDLSKVKDEQLILMKSKFNLNSLIDEAVKDIKIFSPESNIKVEHTFFAEVEADRDRIEQVVINLVTNAIKYSPDNKNIEVKTWEDKDGKIAVGIKDYGLGIEQKEIQKIFKRFYRISDKNEETFSGFGIGLFLVNEIIERHNGSINVISKKGEGSEFIFKLNKI